MLREIHQNTEVMVLNRPQQFEYFFLRLKLQFNSPLKKRTLKKHYILTHENLNQHSFGNIFLGI